MPVWILKCCNDFGFSCKNIGGKDVMKNKTITGDYYLDCLFPCFVGTAGKGSYQVFTTRQLLLLSFIPSPPYDQTRL